MQFENKGKWVNQINESKQRKNEGRPSSAEVTKVRNALYNAKASYRSLSYNTLDNEYVVLVNWTNNNEEDRKIYDRIDKAFSSLPNLKFSVSGDASGPAFISI